MKCVRCGAVGEFARGLDWLCGRCALAHDWEEIIAIAQEAVVAHGRGAAPPASPPRQATA
jgi:NMD protein affecting ribosome stability and mRNA decay